MSKDLLLEIGTEEIPAGYIAPAIKQLEENIIKIFKDEKIEFKGNIITFSTPRRLAILVKGVSEIQEDISLEVMGPPKKVAYDGNGNPTPAAAGFAKNQGIEIADLVIKTTPKGEYICASKHIKGKPCLKILPLLMEKLISSINWPKSMRWSGDFRFPRPIRSVLCLFGSRTVKFTIADVKSSNKTYGHRILSPSGKIIRDPAKYKSILKEKFVIADYEERKEEIINQIKSLAKKVNGTANIDEKILEENVNTVEYPTAMLGEFDAKYLKLPKELLLQVMEKTQKYFSVWDEKKEKILPYFIAIKNGKKTFVPVIIDGNKRVLKARFEDAEFFFNEDKKSSLFSKVSKLKSVSFQDQLGSMYDKSVRLVNLVKYTHTLLKITDLSSIIRACELSKVDLTTGMVREFTELQGIMGREYAIFDGETNEVATAIFEHYLPRYLGDSLPTGKTGVILAIFDKIDTITGCFSIGLVPTGSQDPYGLRRNALGIISIILDNNLDFSLSELIASSIETYGDKVKVSKEKLQKDILEFIKVRMENILLEKSFRYDIVNSVLVKDYDNICITFKKAEELNKVALNKDFNPVITTLSRVINILPKELSEDVSLNPDLLKEEAEKILFSQFESRKENYLELITQKDFSKAFAILKELAPFIDRFFDKVLVMDKDETIKNNRIALLKKINSFMLKICDFSKIIIG